MRDVEQYIDQFSFELSYRLDTYLHIQEHEEREVSSYIDYIYV